MEVKLKNYTKYKDSGIPWLGKIPMSWKLQRAKWYLRSKKEINADGACTDVLSLTLRGVVDNDPNNPEGLVPSDYRSYQIFEKNDLVFKLIDLENYKTSRAGLVHRRGIMSPAYIRVTVDSKNLSPKFYYYFYYSLYLQGVYNKIGAGVRATLSAKDLLELPIPIPEKQEQEKITVFLDQQLSQIAHFLRKKRRLIELLNEQKQVIINQAVTRGIDPNVRLKPSGVDYLGDIPEHWEVRRLKYLTKGALQYGANEPAMYTNPDWPRYVRITDIKSDGNLRDDTFCSLPEDIAAPYLLNYGDILFARSGATVGKTFCYNKDWGRAAYAGYLIRARIDMKKVDPLFVSCFTNSAIYWQWISAIFIKATIQNVSAEKYASIKLPIPPLQEQYKIIEYLDEKCSKIDSAVTRAHHEIDLIREYQTRLISDVVTGKIDVRNIPIEPIEEPEDYEELDMVEEAEKQEEEMEELEEVQNEDI